MEKLSDNDREVLSKHFDYRIPVYVAEQCSQTPKSFIKEVRFNWVLGTCLNLAVLVFVLLSVHQVISENLNSKVKLTRIDGVHVEEGSDIRRDVLMNNALQRANGVNNDGN